MRRLPAWPAAAVLLALVTGTVIVLSAGQGGGPAPHSTASPSDAGPEAPPRAGYLRKACRLPREWIERIQRGWDARGTVRDDDLVIVPHPPNYMGTRFNTSHSGPYDFLQEVPLVLYGPGFIEPQGRVDLGRETTIADIAPTIARLMHFDERRQGPTARPLDEVLTDTEAAPKLIVTAVVDGGGWNVLEEWPEAWPHIRELIAEGVNVDGAIVGSSPSITPATHTNLSTGLFPRQHAITAIVVRGDDGSLSEAFSTGMRTGSGSIDPTAHLRATTIADDWDLANRNAAEIGAVIPGSYQAGLVGRGAALEGADKDIVAAYANDRSWTTTTEFYSLPSYVNEVVGGPEPEIEAVDRADGTADGKWGDHEITRIEPTPAFAPWENRTMQAVIDREGFGDDDITDLFFVNYKSPDAAGHIWNMIGAEQEDVLRSVDSAVGDMVEFLDREVGEEEYVFILTADHGQTPLGVGGYPISRGELLQDIAARFTPGAEERITEQTSASEIFLRRDQLDANDVTSEEVATWLSRYTIGDNLSEEGDTAEEFAERRHEEIFDAVIPGGRLPRVARCAGLS